MGAEVLKKELATYDRELERLKREHAGKYVLIKGENVVGTFDTFATAAGEGLRLCADEPFLVRKIGSEAPALPISLIYGLTRADR